MLAQMLKKHCFLRNYVSCIQLNVVVQITFLIAIAFVLGIPLLLNRPDDNVLAACSSMIKLKV